MVLDRAPAPLFSPPPPTPVNPVSVHFRSKTDVWATPQELFDELHREFAFTLDVCAMPTNAKCERYFSPEVDGLKQNWSGVCWMNPPYGRTIARWVQKAFESAQAGATVVCLLPSRTDTEWWHRFVVRGEVRFLRGRVRFGNAKASAPFPSVVVVFRPPDIRMPRWARGVFLRRGSNVEHRR